MNCNQETINQLIRDVALIKEHLFFARKDTEGELSDWAKKELAEARKIPRSENISIEELEMEILAK